MFFNFINDSNSWCDCKSYKSKEFEYILNIIKIFLFFSSKLYFFEINEILFIYSIIMIIEFDKSIMNYLIF
jgi:hypothetical protein